MNTLSMLYLKNDLIRKLLKLEINLVNRKINIFYYQIKKIY